MVFPFETWTSGELTGSRQIVVERLSKNINEQHLYEIFGQFGRVKDLDLPINRNCELVPTRSHTPWSLNIN